MQRKSQRLKAVEQRDAKKYAISEQLSSYSSSEEVVNEQEAQEYSQLEKKYKNIKWTRVFSM